MSEAFYSYAGLYDLMFPDGGPAASFYRAGVNRQRGRVLELGCGTGQKLIPIATNGHPCVGLELSSDMLAQAQRKATERGVPVEWMQGDMRAFDLGRAFDFVFIAAISLLHLQEAADPVSCFRSVLRHLAPGARFVLKYGGCRRSSDHRHGQALPGAELGGAGRAPYCCPAGRSSTSLMTRCRGRARTKPMICATSSAVTSALSYIWPTAAFVSAWVM